MPITILLKGQIKEKAMGLACSQARFLSLTARKADIEYDISIDAARKMSLTREQTELAREYNSKLRAKKVSYYANGSYQDISYQYIMGYASMNTQLYSNNSIPIINNNNIVLTDNYGRVAIGGDYLDAFSYAGLTIDAYGRGAKFSEDKIVDILMKLYGSSYPKITEDDIKEYLKGKDFEEGTYNAGGKNQLTLEETDTNTTINYKQYAALANAIDVIYPKLLAAARNGWTTEFNDAMGINGNYKSECGSYIGDSLINGTMHLALVNKDGKYNENTSINYFLTGGFIAEKTDTHYREEVTAWYEEEKARIAEKEDYIDLDIRNLSTELEAIKTEMQAVKTLIDDAISVFDWGSN